MSYACAITEDQRDCYQELTNVAMGRAAERLAKLLDTFVRLPVPRVSMIENSDIRMAIQEVGQDSSVSAVCQGFVGSSSDFDRRRDGCSLALARGEVHSVW